jgi:hypothetical protein
VDLFFFLYKVGTGLCGSQLAQTTDGRANGNGGGGGRGVGSSSNDLVAAVAGPDADVSTSDSVLTAELARVLGVLRNLNLADLLTDGRTVAGSVLSDDTDLLCSTTL